MTGLREDTYGSFAELQAEQRRDRDFCVSVRKVDPVQTVILAPHGGGIEPGTSEIARAVAGADLSFALFEGLKREGNCVLHITSTNFDEPECLNLVRACEYVVAIHGERSQGRTVYIGGKDIALTKALTADLEQAGFDVAEHRNPRLQAKSAQNICNRGIKNAGVQLELAAGLRHTFFASLRRAGRERKTEEFSRFVAAIRDGLRAGGALPS